MITLIGEKWAAKHPASALAVSGTQVVLAGAGLVACAIHGYKLFRGTARTEVELDRGNADRFDQAIKLRDQLDADREKRLAKEAKAARKAAEEKAARKAEKKARQADSTKLRQEFEALSADAKALVTKFGGTPGSN